MSAVGKVDSLWRYPVKSMRGEELEEAFLGFSGVYGDRLFAFRSSASPKGFPYLTGREQEELLLYRPRFRHPDKAAKPPNLSEAESIAPGINPLFRRRGGPRHRCRDTVRRSAWSGRARPDGLAQQADRRWTRPYLVAI